MSEIKNKTLQLIDALKATCQTYGMGNDGNEYKIITQVFLYKFLNDKFGFNEIGPDFFEKLFREAIEVAAERNVSLYCGEYGVIDRADPKESIKWYRDINSVFEKYGIGRAAWTYKEKDFGLIGPAYDEIRDEIIELL